jgi:ectoine hydroxylase-related dioxygenase (phytanoyl-CoA dioxygenase family)
MEERTTYQKAFLQVMNIWTKCDVVKEFVFSKRLARIAAELMGTAGVRMYHDQALYKEGKGGFTPWHADQYYWPLASTHSITAWIPLQKTPMEMGPLAFAPKSHLYDLGRDLEISDKSQQQIEKKLLAHNLGQFEEPFDLGEVSFHSGWTFHRAGRNLTDLPREVMTVIYMDEDMRPRRAAQREPAGRLGRLVPRREGRRARSRRRSIRCCASVGVLRTYFLRRPPPRGTFMRT